MSALKTGGMRISSIAGAFPAPNWTLSGNSDVRIDNNFRASGNQSVRLYGLVGGCWAALLHRPLNVSPPFTIEFQTRGSMAQNLCQDAILSEVSSNCTPERVGRPAYVTSSALMAMERSEALPPLQTAAFSALMPLVNGSRRRLPTKD